MILSTVQALRKVVKTIIELRKMIADIHSEYTELQKRAFKKEEARMLQEDVKSDAIRQLLIKYPGCDATAIAKINEGINLLLNDRRDIEGLRIVEEYGGSFESKIIVAADGSFGKWTVVTSHGKYRGYSMNTA